MVVIDLYVEELEDLDEYIDELEEELLGKKEEIQEDLSIRVETSVKISSNEYENFDIEHYLEKEDNIEDEIYKVIDLFAKKLKEIKEIKELIKKFESIR